MLSITKKVLPIIALAAAFTLAFGGEAQAQHGHVNHRSRHQGGFHGHAGHIYPSQPSFRVPAHHQPHYPSPGIQWHRPRYHDTTHVDWHGPSLRRHGHHAHIQPGHYDVHRSGHWH